MSLLLGMMLTLLAANCWLKRKELMNQHDHDDRTQPVCHAAQMIAAISMEVRSLVWSIHIGVPGVILSIDERPRTTPIQGGGGRCSLILTDTPTGHRLAGHAQITGQGRVTASC
jgi:hypothetical protein